jgi:F-type H+-transporting ATPase subunit a
MHLSSDSVVIWRHGFFNLNETIVTTWALMLVMTVASILVTRNISPNGPVSRWQGSLEIIVTGIQSQIKDVGLHRPEKYLGFVGTLFLFIAMSNLLIIIPGYEPPTGSLSTTTALAICVFAAVPIFAIASDGLRNYLKTFLEPTAVMLPFNIIGEFTRTLTLAVRLFGNIMSGSMIVGILLIVTPLLLPSVMNALGLLIGMIQAYIFAILATVYIAAATQVREGNDQEKG